MMLHMSDCAIIVDYMPNPIGTQFSIDHIPTPCGAPSEPIMSFTVDQKNIILIQRYGVDRSIPPHQVNYAANIWSLYALGIKNVISLSVVGSLNATYVPGTVAVPTRFVDGTKFRKESFHDGAGFTFRQTESPYTSSLVQLSKKVLGHYPLSICSEVCCLTVEGVRFPSKGESDFWINGGVDVVSFTDYPENILCQQIDINYVFLGLIGWVSPGVGHFKVNEGEVDQLYLESMEVIWEAIKEIISKL